MAAASFLLTDVDSGTHIDRGEITPAPALRMSGSNRWSVRWKTLRGGVSEGVQVVELDNGRMSLSILPTRGWESGKAGWVICRWNGIHPLNARFIRHSSIFRIVAV